METVHTQVLEGCVPVMSHGLRRYLQPTIVIGTGVSLTFLEMQYLCYATRITARGTDLLAVTNLQQNLQHLQKEKQRWFCRVLPA